MAIDLRSFTPARVELGLTGHSVPTAEPLRFQLDLARARDAVHRPLDPASLGIRHLLLHSAAPDRVIYLRRPDLGRKLKRVGVLAPITVVLQGRVAVGDEIGELLGAQQVVVLIGERPGLTSPDSLGIYLTWNPHPGRTDAERNCISNVRTEGVSYAASAHKLHFLMREARTRQISGVGLKEDAPLLPDSRRLKHLLYKSPA